MRGAGQSPLSILSIYMTGALVLGALVTFIISPLALSFESWGKQIEDPSSNPRLEYYAGPYTAWVSLDEGRAQARLQNYQTDLRSATDGQLVLTQFSSLEGDSLGFFFLSNINLTDQQMQADLRSPEGEIRRQTFDLDHAPKIISRDDASVVRSAPTCWDGSGLGLIQGSAPVAFSLPFTGSLLCLS